MRIRPCIDLHQGKVKQLVGETLTDSNADKVKTNFIADKSAAYFAQLYKDDGLEGGHVIMLGPENEEAAKSALSTYPNGLHIGGGITYHNALDWLEAGADKIIITSYVFRNGTIDMKRLNNVSKLVTPQNLVLDLSCKKHDSVYYVATDRWQKLSNYQVSEKTLHNLAPYCSEFLIHAVDAEGYMAGIDHNLLNILTKSPVTVTYAGGIQSMEDLERIDSICEGRVDATVGSALDIFGGNKIRYRDAVEFDKAHRPY